MIPQQMCAQWPMIYQDNRELQWFSIQLSLYLHEKIPSDSPHVYVAHGALSGN